MTALRFISVTDVSKELAAPIFRVIKEINDSKNLTYIYFYVNAILILSASSKFLF